MLVSFIDSITERVEEGIRIAGARKMVDLARLAELHFFHPRMSGSSSLNKVLPAAMASSNTLRDLYSVARYGSREMRSLNLEVPVAWWVSESGSVIDPYSLLPPVFSGLSLVEQAAPDAEVAPELAEGGAAMTAYAKLQFETLQPDARAAIEIALKRYCELDTLAIVMIVQAWQGWLSGP